MSLRHGASALPWSSSERSGTLIGEAAGPIVAGFLIVSLGYASTFDTLALVIVAVGIAVVLLLQDPKIG